MIASQHEFELHNNICKHCKRTMEEVVDMQWHCRKLACNECTLVRDCIGDPPRCEECWQNMHSNKLTNADLCEASLDAIAEQHRKNLVKSWYTKVFK